MNSVIDQISLNPGFLSDIAAFSAVVLAILIPITFEITSRIADKYQSDILTRQFDNRLTVKALPYLLVVMIILAITLRLFVSEEVNCHWLKLIMLLELILFFCGSIAILRIFYLLRLYTANIDKVLQELFENAEKTLK